VISEKSLTDVIQPIAIEIIDFAFRSVNDKQTTMRR
jgi:hypothetical protein